MDYIKEYQRWLDMADAEAAAELIKLFVCSNEIAAEFTSKGDAYSD